MRFARTAAAIDKALNEPPQRRREGAILLVSSTGENDTELNPVREGTAAATDKVLTNRRSGGGAVGPRYVDPRARRRWRK